MRGGEGVGGEEGGAGARHRLFLDLLAPLERALLGYARRALDAPGEAEDALQAAILRAFRDFDRFVEGTSFRAYAFTYLVHEVQNANRRSAPRTFGLEPPEGSERGPDVIEMLETEEAYQALLTAPERVLALLDAPLAGAVRALPEQERVTFLLRSVGELSYAEIAAVRAVPLGSVMTWLHRARAQLRRALTDYAVAHRLAPRGGPSEGAP